MGDFVEGGEIWVRGKRATCLKVDRHKDATTESFLGSLVMCWFLWRQVDFPHIYWRWDGSSAEKHRSFLNSSHIFKVDVSARLKHKADASAQAAAAARSDTPTNDPSDNAADVARDAQHAEEASSHFEHDPLAAASSEQKADNGEQQSSPEAGSAQVGSSAADQKGASLSSEASPESPSESGSAVSAADAPATADAHPPD
jgi:hypothetical protein